MPLLDEFLFIDKLVKCPTASSNMIDMWGKNNSIAK